MLCQSGRVIFCLSSGELSYLNQYFEAACEAIPRRMSTVVGLSVFAKENFLIRMLIFLYITAAIGDNSSSP